MITDLLIGLLAGILRPVLGLLPQVELDDTIRDAAEAGGVVGSYVSIIDAAVPVAGPLRAILALLMATFPALLAYRAGLWLYNRLRG